QELLDELRAAREGLGEVALDLRVEAVVVGGRDHGYEDPDRLAVDGVEAETLGLPHEGDGDREALRVRRADVRERDAPSEAPRRLALAVQEVGEELLLVRDVPRLLEEDDERLE